MKKVNELRFGTAGIPVAAQGQGTAAGIAKVSELGLGSFELEFVRSVNISQEKAPEIKKVAEEKDIVLTAHASYFINLNSPDKEKQDASRKRLYDAARIAALCGGYSTCVHAGSYLKMDKEAVYQTIKKQFEKVVQQLRDDGKHIWVRPETAGKFAQFAPLPELLKLSQETEGVMPCIDFGHMRATTGANSYESFSEILAQVEKVLGKEGLHNMHIHAEGISFGEKGEKAHLNFADSDLKYKEMVRAFKDFKIRGVVTCESPNIEQDALAMKKVYDGL